MGMKSCAKIYALLMSLGEIIASNQQMIKSNFQENTILDTCVTKSEQYYQYVLKL